MPSISALINWFFRKSGKIHIVVPSTSNVGEPVSSEEFENRVKVVLRWLSENYGGATAGSVDKGGYIAHDGRLIVEDVRILWTFTNDVRTALNDVSAYASKLAREWSQESILVFTDSGKAKFIEQ